MADIAINPVSRRVQYTGNTGLGPFAFTFNILADADIAVYKNTTLLTLTSEYTVATNADGTGSITLTGSGNGTALVASDVLTLIGARQLERTTDFVAGGDFFAASINEQLDSQVIMAQQLDEKLTRAIKVNPGDEFTDLELPLKADRIGKTLQFNATTGDPEAGPSIADVANAQSNALAAASSATAAATSASSASSSASSASSSATSASSSATAASASETAAAASESAAATSETNAANSASSASSSASAAASSESAAATSETNAANSATAAASSETAAQSAQTAAESARDATLAAYDNFDDRYLGAKASDPTLDNDGNALIAGALYFNTADEEMKLYTGSAWVAAYVSGSGFLATTNNLSDLTNAATARTNLGVEIGVDVQAYDATLLNDADIGVTVQGYDATLLNDADIGATVQAYDADTAKLDVAQSFTAAQRGSTDTDTTNTGNVTLDFATNQNFVLTLTGNVTLDNPTTEAVGQSGFIVFIQDATGGRTVSLGTDYETAGGAGLTLSSAASTTDVVPYIVAASGRILLGAPQLAFA